MWSPTHIQVTVQKAKGLLTKGKNGTNNCFVTIGLGKEKYQTSVKEKAETNVSWNEECELKIPDQGNRAELVLTCLHRNNLGIDEFLGQVTQPLNEMDVYDRPRSKWFKLESKPGKEKKNKERGELEVRISFVVKSGSLTDLSKKDKHKSSIGQLASSVGGSLLSIGTIEKRKGIKKFAKSLGSKMHLHSKKKNKDGDDLSFNGSLASVGTPESSNGGSRRYGQRAGEADPGVISEDEDEFVFDNLSHKSSGSSLNIRSKGLQPPTQNFAPRVPSPLLAGNGKIGGKQEQREFEKVHDIIIDEGELEEIENDFSVRARTLPPPSKPPRTQQQIANDQAALNEEKLNEWESKLYGNKLDAGKSDSLKRRSWETARVPLSSANEVHEEKEDTKIEEINSHPSKDSSASSSDSDDDEDKVVPAPVKEVRQEINLDSPKKPQLQLELDDSTKVQLRNSLLSPESGKTNFNQFNASFAKFEQRNSAKIFKLNEEEEQWNSQALIDNESQEVTAAPKALPRSSREDNAIDLKKQEDEQKLRYELKRQDDLKLQEEQRLREEERQKEDEKLEAELKLNERRLREEEAQFQEESRLQDEQKLREAKRFEEDQKLLNFAKRSSSVEESDEGFTTPSSSQQQSPKEKHSGSDKKGKRFNKFKYFTKRDDSSLKSSPKSNERIIIGHEKSATHAERRSEMTAALSKKYEGKSREELMLIANGMENEALLQRQRVKELEDYLDNLLLRVMETHPKILQNPYSRTTSAKSG